MARQLAWCSAAMCHVLLTVLAAMAATSAAPADSNPQPKKCCFDKQFTALLGEAGGAVRQGHYKTLKGNIRLAYDFYRSRQCSINTVLQLMAPTKPPTSSLTMLTATFGYGSEALDIDSWKFPLPGNTKIHVTLAVTQHCVPFAQAIYGNMGEGDTQITYFFTDDHSGIEDLDALNPPANCPISPPVNATSTNQIGRRSIGLF